MDVFNYLNISWLAGNADQLIYKISPAVVEQGSFETSPFVCKSKNFRWQFRDFAWNWRAPVFRFSFSYGLMGLPATFDNNHK